MAEKHKNDPDVKKIASQLNFIVRNKLGRLCLHCLVQLYQSCNKSKEEYRQGNIREISEQKIVDIVIHVSRFYN